MSQRTLLPKLVIAEYHGESRVMGARRTQGGRRRQPTARLSMPASPEAGTIQPAVPAITGPRPGSWNCCGGLIGEVPGPNAAMSALQLLQQSPFSPLLSVLYSFATRGTDWPEQFWSQHIPRRTRHG